MKKVNLSDKFSQFTEHWSPKTVGELNGQHVKLVKVKGKFVMHHHDHEDELFLVIKGQLKIAFEKETVTLEQGEFIIVPRGVRHQPFAEEETEILLFEPASTLNTGNESNEMTVRNLENLT
jgi:mannose-6-phosphate isomerase-like protein (cupin superfamily)